MKIWKPFLLEQGKDEVGRGKEKSNFESSHVLDSRKHLLLTRLCSGWKGSTFSIVFPWGASRGWVFLPVSCLRSPCSCSLVITTVHNCLLWRTFLMDEGRGWKLGPLSPIMDFIFKIQCLKKNQRNFPKNQIFCFSWKQPIWQHSAHVPPCQDCCALSSGIALVLTLSISVDSLPDCFWIPAELLRYLSFLPSSGSGILPEKGTSIHVKGLFSYRAENTKRTPSGLWCKSFEKQWWQISSWSTQEFWKCER